nr:hypothetical protein [Micromonospora sp. DSM 115978]
MVAALVATTVAASPAAAQQDSPGDEGGKTLREVFEAASKGHIEATNKLENSKKRQSELGLQLELVESRLQSLSVELGVVAAESYRLGRLTPMSMLLNSASPDAFLERAAGLDVLAQRDGRKLRELIETREQAERAKAAIDNEVKEQKKQLAVIARKKQDAERALATVNGSPSGGYISANSPLAKPAPRNADGSWPSESCTIDDPTTGGCITPRTLHAYKQARAVDFTRHTSCHRSGGGGDHPDGQACDFSSATNTFKNSAATGGDRTYGNNLAAFFVKNANRLGVAYVIWFRQIWMPNTGWRAYRGGSGAAAEHTNHVHLSMV